MTPLPQRRPCGACGALVDGVKGCVHWKPGNNTAAVNRRRSERWKAKMKALNASLEVTRRLPPSVAGLGKDYS